MIGLVGEVLSGRRESWKTPQILQDQAFWTALIGLAMDKDVRKHQVD